MKCKILYRYSGPRSEVFWKRINDLKDKNPELWDKLYGMGCELQNLEGKILRLLGIKDKCKEQWFGRES